MKIQIAKTWTKLRHWFQGCMHWKPWLHVFIHIHAKYYQAVSLYNIPFTETHPDNNIFIIYAVM